MLVCYVFRNFVLTTHILYICLNQGEGIVFSRDNTASYNSPDVSTE